MKPQLIKLNYTVIFIMLILLIGLVNIYYPFITTNPLTALTQRLTSATSSTSATPSLTQQEIETAQTEARRAIGEIEEAALIKVNSQLAEIKSVEQPEHASATIEGFYQSAAGAVGEAGIYELRLFWSPKCEYSRKFMPVWLNVLRALPDTVTYKEFNCDKSESSTSSLSVCSKTEYGIKEMPTVQLYRVVDGVKHLDSLSGYRDYRAVKGWLRELGVTLKYNPNAENFRNTDNFRNAENFRNTITGPLGEQFAGNVGAGMDPLDAVGKIYGSTGELREQADIDYMTESGLDDWGHYRDVKDGCYKASFGRCNEDSERPGFQVFTPRGQWGCVFPQPGTAIATEFDAAFAAVDNYLATCVPPKQNKDGKLSRVQYTDAERQTKMNQCALKYKDQIRNFGLCDEEKLTEKFNYANMVKMGKAKLPLAEMSTDDYVQTAKTATAIFNSCKY